MWLEYSQDTKTQNMIDGTRKALAGIESCNSGIKTGLEAWFSRLAGPKSSVKSSGGGKKPPHPRAST
jgi:hypothetical protein